MKRFLLLMPMLICCVSCDYMCLCNYSVHKPVYESISNSSKILGYLDKDECREVFQPHLQQNSWASISFEQKVGYVMKDSNVDLLSCTGSPTIKTTVSTTMKISSSTVTSATTSTTTQITTTTVRPTSSTTITATPRLTSSSSMSSHACPENVQQAARPGTESLFVDNMGRKCYEFVQSRFSWSYAERSCQQKGGHLATIESTTENSLLKSYVHSHGHPVWIGLNDRDSEDNFVWSSGASVTYTNWHAGSKELFLHGLQDCVAMGPLTGTWEDTDCSMFYAYICEYTAVNGHGLQNHQTTPSSTLNNNSDGNIHVCPSSVIQNTILFNNHILGQYGLSCYEIIKDNKVTWSNGERICTRYGGHLAYITNSNEQAFVEAFMNRHYPKHAVWIGLNDVNTEGNFQWTSGKPVTYTNWKSGHTSNFFSHNEEDCVLFIPYENGQWDDIPCGHEAFPFGDSGQRYPILCQYDTLTHDSNLIIG